MIKTLFLIAALLVPGLAYAANPSAPFSVQVVDPPNGTPCDIGPPYTGAIPAAAAQAGFTHCAANYDFTQTQQWTDSAGTHQWSNLSSWLNCTTNGGTPYLLFNFGDVPCDTNHQNITTDSGAQVFALSYSQADHGAGHWINRLQTTSNNSGAVFKMAEEYYIEFVMRPSTNTPCSTNCQYTALSTYTAVAGNPCFFATDMEWDQGQTGTGVGQAWWNMTPCGTSGNFRNGTCGAYPNCSTPVNGPINTSVDTWGNLTTGDGVSQAASCNYWGAGAISGLPASAFKSCFSNTVVPPASSTAVFNTQPLYIYITALGDTIDISSYTTYIQRFTVWQCPGYKTGPCITNPVITTAP
jgi:hypothetical protein